MNQIQVQWIGSSCGRHGSYTFYKGFKINSHGTDKSYCLGEFYFVRNSEDRPICIAELQLIWHDASNDSKLASARLYFKPENTPFGRQSIHGKDELLYADQKAVIKCEDMVQWECSGSSWTTGLTPTLETDFVPVKATCIDKFTGKPENKYRLKNTSLETIDNTPTEKIIILTFQAYCRYIALQKRLLTGTTIGKSEIASLGGIVAPSKSTRVVFCRESFSCPDVDQFHLSGENKAPVLKGRPRKKKLRHSTLAKELKRKRFLADLEREKNKNLPSKKMKLSESEEGTESDLSEESTKSYESMDEDKPHYSVETPINKIKHSNGLWPVSIKQVAKVMNVNEKDSKNTEAPPPLIPTSKIVKITPSTPPPLQKVKIKIEPPVVAKIDTGPPPLYPAVQKLESLKKIGQSVPRLLPRVNVSEIARTQGNLISSSSSKPYTVIKSCSVGIASFSSSTTTTTSKSEIVACNSVKAVEPLGNVGKQTLNDGKTNRLQSCDDMKMEGKENQKDSNKTDVIKTKKKRLRQPCNVKELNEDFADEDEKYFMRSLREFMKSRDTPISKIPALGFKRVNLWTMYNTAQKLGGYDMVTSKRLWRQVYDALGGSTTITSAATYTRRHYERLLLPYESFMRSQLNNKKGVSEPTQSAHTSSGQESTHKGQPIKNNQSDTTANTENNTILKNGKMSISHNNQSSSSMPRDSNNQSVAIASRNGNTSAGLKPSSNSSTPGDLINQPGATTGSSSITATDKLLVNNIKTSTLRNTNTSGSVVKIKPNGVIPPYSISVQSIKKDGVTQSPSVIVTKSINVPSSPVIRNSATVLEKNVSVPASSSKSDTHVTSNLIQRATSVTPNAVSRQPAVSQTSSQSSRTVINVTPVKSSSTETYPSTVKQSPAVKVVPIQEPKKHSVDPPKQIFVTLPSIQYLPKKQVYQNNNNKETVDHRGVSANYVTSIAHPRSTEEGHKITQPKSYQAEEHSSEPVRFHVQNSLNHKRELKHVSDHSRHHQGDVRTYDINLLQNIRKSSNKRIAQVELDKEVPRAVVGHNQGFGCEPIAKRKKTPSPAMTKVTPQPLDITQDTTTQLRNKCHLAYSQSDTVYSSRIAIQSHDDGRSKLYSTNASFKEGVQVNEKSTSHLGPVPAKQNSSNVQREVVDLTESSIAVASSSHSVTCQRTSKSPYSKVTHSKQQYIAGESCQRTEPRLHGNSRNAVVTHGNECTESRGHPDENQSKESRFSRHYKEAYPSPQPTYRFTKEVKLPITFDHKQSKAEVEISQLNAEVQRTITHRTFAKSPDEHFQEWRRRQGMTQYPAYITTNHKEQARRSSMTEQPVSLCPSTPPLEPRCLYVQDDGPMHQVIGDVPLIISAKPGMYYQDETFYGGMPFYPGGWTTAGVADGVTFKGDRETMNNNSHLRSSSCIFMPTSQMFGSAVPIAPLSPPVINQGHVVSGQETVSIHPHLLMTSPYPHSHQMVSQTPTRPLHSYT